MDWYKVIDILENLLECEDNNDLTAEEAEAIQHAIDYIGASL